MVYFENRTQAGQALAAELADYKGAEVAVVALNTNAVLVAKEIADQLDCPVNILLMEPIEVPGEPGTNIGVVNQRGDFVYSQDLGRGMRDELEMEFHNKFAGEKIQKFHEINSMINHEGVVTPEIVADKNVIIVSDGAANGTEIDAVTAYLKPIHIKRLIAAIPLATIEVVDRLHIACDELHVLGVIPGNFAPNHYYDDSSEITHEQLQTALNSSASKA